jgi:hypothetical protein
MSNPFDNSGPAFPHQDTGVETRSGMSLRDYFAAAALPGIVEQLRAGVSMLAGVDGLAGQVAHEAYALADAMLAERARKGEGAGSLRNAALEEAARAVENDCGIGIQHGDKIRALKEGK